MDELKTILFISKNDLNKQIIQLIGQNREAYDRKSDKKEGKILTTN